MRSINVLIFLLFLSNSCSAQKGIKGKVYEYSNAKERSVFYNRIHFKSDSTLSIGGGKGKYSYSSFWNYKVLNSNKYFIYQPNSKRTKPTKEELKDTIGLKVYMADVFNDTIYWNNNKEFIFRERLFKLFEYSGVPLEDQ